MSQKSEYEGHRVRLRDAFLAGEAASRTDEALLELLLTFGIPRRDVQPLAKALLSRFGGLDKVLAADLSSLRAVDGVESHVSTLLKLADYLRQSGSAPRPAIGIDEHDRPAASPAPPAPERAGPASIAGVPLAQSEMPLNIPGQSELPLAQKIPTIRERKTIQDVLIPEGLLALKLAHEAKSPEELHEILMKRLGQNSMETRRRYAQSVARWFFPDGPTGLLSRVWRAYEDEAISTDLLRWSYLSQEPIMGRCVAEALFPCETGLGMPATYFDRFLQEHLGEPPSEKTRKRLKTNLKKLGFLDRSRGKPDRLLPVATQKTSFLILLHHLFAAKAVRTVEFRNLTANPFWKYLGYKSEDAVRGLLREADAAGLVAKYVVADQLEQVTTCFTLDELLEEGTAVKTPADLQALIGSRNWDKDLVMWIGSEKSLHQALGPAKSVIFDLLDLFDLENLPADDDSTRDQLRDRLRDKLRGIAQGPDHRVILIVKSIGLLARYNAGLNAFYEWFIGDFTMVVLLLDGGSEKVDWPEEVRCEGNRLLSYFSEPGMVKEVFSTSG